MHAEEIDRSTRADAIDEMALLAALRTGQEWAFETLVRVFGGRLLSVARRFVRNDEDAQDVVQSAYLNAFRSLDQFEGSAQLSTWLHRIVVNAALMKLRSRRRKPEESIEALLPGFLEDGHHVESSRSGRRQPIACSSERRHAGPYEGALANCRPATGRCSSCATSKSGPLKKSRRYSPQRRRP